MRYHDQELITKLSPSEVFVYGSNNGGFHGAGSAGFAFKGTAKNDWRTNPRCQTAMHSHTAKDKVGKWCVWGQARGYQVGAEGASYAIVTTQSPGVQGNVTLESVREEVQELAKFAKSRPDLTFLCTPFGLNRAHNGYSWFTPDQIRGIFEQLEKEGALPDNVLLHKGLHPDKADPELQLGL